MLLRCSVFISEVQDLSSDTAIDGVLIKINYVVKGTFPGFKQMFRFCIIITYTFREHLA